METQGAMAVAENRRCCKVYVDVLARFSSSGEMMPTGIVWEDGRVFVIQKVLDIRRTASFKAGGVGLRYTCMIDSKQGYLFYEDNNRWFVEGK